MVRVLVVDDTVVERRRAGAILEKQDGSRHFPPSPPLEVSYAANGREALDSIRGNPPELVVTDLLMPELNGLELVREIRNQHPAVPVILMTAHGSEEIAAAALQVGAAGYVPKRHLARDLRETVDNVLDLTEANREQQHILEALQEAETRFVLRSNPRLVGPLIGFLQNNLNRLALFDYVEALRVTVALREAVVNAIVHGCLEVPAALRETDEQAHRRLQETRLQEAPYKDRRVHVLARETPAEVRYVIRDEGKGFDLASLPGSADPTNFEKQTGRGLYLIRTFMDEVTHNDVGNEITMVKRKPKEARPSA